MFRRLIKQKTYAINGSSQPVLYSKIHKRIFKY